MIEYEESSRNENRQKPRAARPETDFEQPTKEGRNMDFAGRPRSRFNRASVDLMALTRGTERLSKEEAELVLLSRLKKNWLKIRKMERVDCVDGSFYAMTSSEYKELDSFREELLEQAYFVMDSERIKRSSERDCFKRVVRDLTFKVRLKELSMVLGITYEQAVELDKVTGVTGS